MTITNGTIEFEQRLVDGDFRHRCAKASISFEGENYDTARRIAVQQARKALGLEPDSQIITPPAVQASPVKAPVQTVATTSAMEQRHSAEVIDLMPKSDDLTPPKRGRKSAANPPQSTAASSISTDGDGPPQVSDLALQAACQARATRGMVEQDVEVGNKIRALVAKYTGETGKKASDIPQEKRLSFLNELNGFPQ